jgi:hypothetical protein
LLSSKFLGFKGDRICTLGRLTLFGTDAELARVLKEYAKPPFTRPKDRATYFAEDILIPLGFKVDSVDNSNYEGANIVHDLNHPIPQSMLGQYDLVFDGGTLEHIFDFPVAIRSAMQLIKVGGHIMLHTPANNQCGHGFYQFSPELFFSLFSPINGFEIVRIYITGPGGPYHVADPASVRGRVTLLNSEGALLMVHAKKNEDVPLTKPQQSDYVMIWNEQTADKNDGILKSYLRRKLSGRQIVQISRILNKLRQHRAVEHWRSNSTFSNHKFYVPVTDWHIASREAFVSRR